MFKIVTIARLVTLLAIALIAWGTGPTLVLAQGCCPQGMGGGSSGGGHAGHPGMSGGQSAHPYGGGGGMPMGGGGGMSMGCGSGGSAPERAEVATDLIKWPMLLQEPAFASRRAQIEAPFRRSPPHLSTPTASDYRKMVKTVEEMKAIVEWFASKSVDTHDYDRAGDFLNKLGTEAQDGLNSPRAPRLPTAGRCLRRSPCWKCRLQHSGTATRLALRIRRYVP